MPKVLPNKSQSGQAVLIVLLAMAVTLTLVLSIVTRSITDISLTATDEDSARAFSAAEAGIENLLIGGPSSGQVGENSSYEASPPAEYGLGSATLALGQVTKPLSGESATVWFVSHDDTGKYFVCNDAEGQPCYAGNSIRFCWGNEGAESQLGSQTPAVEVSTYYDETKESLGLTPNFSGVKVARSAWDPAASFRNPANGFSTPTITPNCSIGGKTYPFGTQINMPAVCSGVGDGCLLFARIKFLYNLDDGHDFSVEVLGGDTLPSQGTLYSSTGLSGESVRKVETIDLYKTPLDSFEAGLFSAGTNADLIKN